MMPPQQLIFLGTLAAIAAFEPVFQEFLNPVMTDFAQILFPHPSPKYPRVPSRVQAHGLGIFSPQLISERNNTYWGAVDKKFVNVRKKHQDPVKQSNNLAPGPAVPAVPVVGMAPSTRRSAARNAKRHTSAIEKAKNTSAGNNKIKELKAELAILMAEAKTSSLGVVRVNQKSKSKSLAKAATSRPKQSKTTTTDEMELDGVESVSLEVWIEPGIQPDALEPENDVDSDKASPSEPNLDVDGEGDSEIISMGDLDVIGPQVVSGGDSVNSGATKVQHRTQFPHSHRLRSLLPIPSHWSHSFLPDNLHRSGGHLKRMRMLPCGNPRRQAAVAPEPSSSGKRRTTRKPKAWSVRHTDDRIYTSFEFLAQFPDEYRALYGNTEPA
ncbi:hypothetical protein B0H14DRAFT_3574129 [Mycena olivaceomarginata]|nr:hypothetical protein B0H14DRAFT_3574129 [Mycena olivaceomarginata]